MGTGLYLCLLAVVLANLLINRRLLQARGIRRSKSRAWTWFSFGGFYLAILWMIAGAAFPGLVGWPVILFLAISVLSDVFSGYLMLKHAKPSSS